MTFEQISLLHFRINSLPVSKIRSIIPPKQGLRESNAFKYLVLIGANPNLTTSAIKFIIGSHNQSVDRNIAYLLELGYVGKKKKSYWVTQLNAWRLDTVYYVTPRGKTAVNGIFEPILDEVLHESGRVNSEINLSQAS